MNFSKLLAYLNGFSLLILMMGIDSLKGVLPYIVMTVNLVYLVIYINRKENEKHGQM